MLYLSTDVPVHQYACSAYLFLFGITCTITFQLICWGMCTQIYLKINLPVYLHPSLLSNHKDLPVTTATCVHAHWCTCSWPYLVILIISFRHTVCTYCPLTCCSKYSQIYPFINQSVPFVCVFHLALHAHLSVNSSTDQRTDRPTRKWMYLLILMLLAITTKTYLPIQLSTCL